MAWRARLALAAAFLTVTVPVAAALPFSASYVFGDSLSDRGNLADLLGSNLPSPPFVHDSFLDGPTAVEVMSQRLGLGADASLFPTSGVDSHGLGLAAGTNYAVAGATASGGFVGVPGGNLPNQISAFMTASGGAADPAALYTMFIGGDDVRASAHLGTSVYEEAGVAAELTGISTLYAAGARNFLVVDVPDVGAAPEFKLYDPDQRSDATVYSLLYNEALQSGLASIAAAKPDGSFKLFDLYSFIGTLISDPALIGITDTTNPCYTNTDAFSATAATSAACGAIDPATGRPANIDQLFFWDQTHPTAKVHEAVGNALADLALTGPSFSSGVPEPGTWGMALLGFAAVGAMRRRGRAAASI